MKSPRHVIVVGKKKPQDVKSLGDLGIDAGSVGDAGAKTKVVNIETPPARTAGQVVKDEGNGAQQILDFLRQHGEGSVRDLGAFLNLTPTGVRQHLADPRARGLRRQP